MYLYSLFFYVHLEECLANLGLKNQSDCMVMYCWACSLDCLTTEDYDSIMQFFLIFTLVISHSQIKAVFKLFFLMFQITVICILHHLQVWNDLKVFEFVSLWRLLSCAKVIFVNQYEYICVWYLCDIYILKVWKKCENGLFSRNIVIYFAS